MDQIRKFGEQTSRILEFKPKGLDFQLQIYPKTHLSLWFRRAYRHRACRGSRWRDLREHSVLYRGSLLQLALATYFCPCYQPPQGKTNLKFYQGKYPSGCTYNFVSHIFLLRNSCGVEVNTCYKEFQKNLTRKLQTRIILIEFFCLRNIWVLFVKSLNFLLFSGAQF